MGKETGRESSPGKGEGWRWEWGCYRGWYLPWAQGTSSLILQRAPPLQGSVPLKSGLHHDSPKAQGPQSPAAVSLSPVDGADTGHSVIVTDTSPEPVPNLPGEHGWVLPLVVPDLPPPWGWPGFEPPITPGRMLPVPRSTYSKVENPGKKTSKQVGIFGQQISQTLVPLRLLGEGPEGVNGGLPRLVSGTTILSLPVSLAWVGLCCC